MYTVHLFIAIDLTGNCREDNCMTMVAAVVDNQHTVGRQVVVCVVAADIVG